MENICPHCRQAIRRVPTRAELLEDQLNMIIEWAEEQRGGPREFDATFIFGLRDQLRDRGNLSPKQVQAVQNIVEKWGIE